MKYVIEWVYEVGMYKDQRYLEDPDFEDKGGGLVWTSDLNKAYRFSNEALAWIYATKNWHDRASIYLKVIEVADPLQDNSHAFEEWFKARTHGRVPMSSHEYMQLLARRDDAYSAYRNLAELCEREQRLFDEYHDCREAWFGATEKK